MWAPFWAHAHSKERGNPEVSSGTYGGTKPNPELVGHPREIVNKVHLYNHMMESADPSDSPDLSKVFPLHEGFTRKKSKNSCHHVEPMIEDFTRMGPLGSPTATLYKVIGEVELTPAAQIGAGPNQSAKTPRSQNSGRILDSEKILVPERTRPSQVRKKNTERSARSGHGSSLGQARTLERPRTPERPGFRKGQGRQHGRRLRSW